jgi:hypothetical protein
VLQVNALARATGDLSDFLISDRRRPRERRMLVVTGCDRRYRQRGVGYRVSATSQADSEKLPVAMAPRSRRERLSRIRDTPSLRITKNQCLGKISRPGAQEAKRFVRFVESVPLELEWPRRLEANGRQPPADPAKTFSTGIWKLNPRTLLGFPASRFLLVDRRSRCPEGRVPIKCLRLVPHRIGRGRDTIKSQTLS